MLDLSTIVPARIVDLAFSSAGELAVATAQELWIGARNSKAVRLSIGKPEAEITCLAFAAKRTLAIGTQQALHLLEPGASSPSATLAVECRWHAMTWSPDEKYIFGGQYEPWVSVIDVAARGELRVLDPDEFDDSGRTALLWIDGGATLVSTAYNKLCRWRYADVIANKAKCRMPKTGVAGHAHLLDVIALGDHSLVAVAEVEGAKAWLQRFAPSGERIGKKVACHSTTRRLGSLGDAFVAFDEESGGRILSSSGELLRVLDRGDELGHVVALAISPDRTSIVAGSEHGLGMWEAASGKALAIVR